MNYLVDDIGTVVTAMRSQAVKLWDENPSSPVATTPYYLYGHRMEINKELLAKDKSKTLKYQKYPLVALRMDFPEEHRNGLIEFTLNMAILQKTDENYNTAQRYENVFKPVLYPLLESFWVQLRNSGLFIWEGDLPEHTKLDRPYWGISETEGNVRNIFSDPLDAIELIDLKLKQNIKC